MAEITAGLVKELRDKSGAGMMDCKKALGETGGDLEQAMDWLRTKGLSKAAKKADRVAAEGLIAVALRDEGAGMTGAAVELNAETDFVARNELFQAGARKAAKAALDADNVETLANARTEDGSTVSEMVTNLIATIGENMMVRRMARFQVESGVVALVLDHHADGRRKVAGATVQVRLHRALEHGDPPELDLLADLDREVGDDLLHALAVELARQEGVAVGRVRGGGVVGEPLRDLAELLVLGDEVGLGVQLDEGTA